MSADPALLETLAALLRAPLSAADLPPALHADLILRGALFTLQQDASPEAVAVLQEAATAGSGDNPQVCALALAALDALAQQNNAPALDALFSLANLHDLSSARQLITQRAYPAPNASAGVLFALFSGQPAALRALDPDLETLTEIFLAAPSPALQERILRAAGQAGLAHWQTIMAALRDLSAGHLAALESQFAAFTPAERILAVERLAAAAIESPPARETLSLLALRYDDPQAAAIALQNGYTPRDPAQRALFLFLTGQWQAYTTFDFDHRLLAAAYESAGLPTRKRLLDQSRRSGQTEWFQALAGSHRARWLNDLTDADYRTAVASLEAAARWEDLWRLAQLASPLWSARILTALAQTGWQPALPFEQEAFSGLVTLARAALDSPLGLRPKYSFHASSLEEFTSLALSPDGQFLALGSVGNALRVWQLGSSAAHEFAILHAAVPQTRALAFSPDGAHLVTAVGDHSLRVYPWLESKTAKALEGHTGLVRSLAIAPDGHTLYSASFDGSIRAWRFPFGPALKTVHQGSGEVFGLALGPGAATLAAAGADSDIAVYQLPSGHLLHRLAGHQATITHLTPAPRSDLIASYSRDASIRLWNTLSGRQIRAIENLTEVVTALCVHPGEELLISGSLKGRLTLYNLADGQIAYELPAHRKAVIGLAIPPGGAQIVSASLDGAVTVWDLEMHLLTRQPVEGLPPGHSARIEQLRAAPAVTSSEQAWLDFLLALLHWKQRFDVQIEAPHSITVGDFDIQLG